MATALTPVRLTLKEAREAKAMTQGELAAKVGVRQATISDLETGKSGRIELELLDRLATALGVEPGSLIVREPKKRRAR
jgi:DNA-binding Xre family transcriptional regulator